jgi:ribosomal protein S18 acetylase RimI-like enzyme
VHVGLARSAADGAPVGYCISSTDASNTGEVESLYVRERWRRQGIGRRLLEAALAWLDGQGVDCKVVCVADGNEHAIAFYRRFGFLPRNTQLVQTHRGRQPREPS